MLADDLAPSSGKRISAGRDPVCGACRAALTYDAQAPQVVLPRRLRRSGLVPATESLDSHDWAPQRRLTPTDLQAVRGSVLRSRYMSLRAVICADAPSACHAVSAYSAVVVTTP